jgi:prepilin-type N-terminal cleavage/methylation domain-containing protein/prepilin-type processing-associated H-X9-DG protein
MGRVIHRSASRDPSGFTLVELLAVIGVIGLLISLLFPAVMAARAIARRAQCQDHLRQIGIAAASYQSACGLFPFTTTGKTAAGSSPRSISPHALLLPYLDLAPVFGTVNFDETGGTSGGKPLSTTNAPLLALSVPWFLCPDDHPVRGANSYRANMGAMPTPGINVGSLIPGAPTESDTGSFRINRALSPAAFTDGLANTVMFAEKLVGGLSSARFVPSRDCFVTPFDIETAADAVAACQNPPSANPPHDAFCGTTWLFGGFDQTWYNHILPPNSRVPDCASNGAGGNGAYTARSFHPASVNLAFADGSVRSIADGIDRLVWRAIGTRAGGESVTTSF